MERKPAASAPSSETGLLPTRILSRVPLPDDLVDAIVAILQHERHEAELAVRGQLLSSTRGILDDWLGGRRETGDAVDALRALIEPKSGVRPRPAQTR